MDDQDGREDPTDDVVAASATDDGEHAPQPEGRKRRGRDVGPLNVRVEVAALDGEEGKLLRQRQAQVMRRVLDWIHDNPAEAHPDSTDQD